MSRDYYWDAAKRASETEGLPPNGLDNYGRAVCELSAEIDRLEDLRRWRPMTEDPDVPAGAPYVLIRQTGWARAVGGEVKVWILKCFEVDVENPQMAIAQALFRWATAIDSSAVAFPDGGSPETLPQHTIEDFDRALEELVILALRSGLLNRVRLAIGQAMPMLIRQPDEVSNV